jgi:uncharacterized membrane protein
MTRFLVLYVAAAVLFFPLDMLWLGVLARDLYRSQLGPLLLDQPRWGFAILFYALYLVGLVVFAMLPAASSGGGLLSAALMGALLGLIAYATYDLTNLAVMRGFPTPLAFIDLAWGTVLSAVTAAGGLALARLVTDLS